ncbi:MAG: hypothetical protein HY828_06260 [Actinobacteria bacterium]|nr:hypothetical protein [Actinomycetota bacterium]
MAAQSSKNRQASQGVRRGRRATAVVMLAAMLAGCSLMTLRSDFSDIDGDGDVAAVAGWTRLSTTDTYIAVANVLPGEAMFTDEANDAEQPLEGELIVVGSGAPVVADARHVEVHLYDRMTGLPVAGLHVTIEVVNLSTGAHFDVPATEMQDLALGDRDRHYGNNVPITGPADIRVIVTAGSERMTFDGHLD